MEQTEIIVNCTTGEKVIQTDTFLPWKNQFVAVETAKEQADENTKKRIKTSISLKLRELGMTNDEINLLLCR